MNARVLRRVAVTCGVAASFAASAIGTPGADVAGGLTCIALALAVLPLDSQRKRR